MKPRTLVLTADALRDLDRQSAYLQRVRDLDYALAWRRTFLRWLKRQAELGAQFGTEHPVHRAYRTFGYRGQLTILAEFTDGTMEVARIRFAGEDWQA